MGQWHEVRMSPLWSDFGAERDPALYTNSTIDTNTNTNTNRSKQHKKYWIFASWSVGHILFLGVKSGIVGKIYFALLLGFSR